MNETKHEQKKKNEKKIKRFKKWDTNCEIEIMRGTAIITIVERKKEKNAEIRWCTHQSVEIAPTHIMTDLFLLFRPYRSKIKLLRCSQRIIAARNSTSSVPPKTFK